MSFMFFAEFAPNEGECKMFVKIFRGSSFSEKTSHPCKWNIRWISLQSACVPVAPERERGIRWTRVKANQSKKVRWISAGITHVGQT